MRKICYVLFITTILILSTLPVLKPYPIDTSDPEIQETLEYLRALQTSDGNIGSYSDSIWVTNSITAAGEDPDTWQSGDYSLVEFLINDAQSNVNLTKANEVEKFILAMVASGENPGSINGINYISALKSLYINGKMSNDTYLSDDFFGLIALAAVGEDSSLTIINDLKSYILSNKNDDGGWGYAEDASSDPDDTAFAIMALLAGGMNPTDPVIASALNHIKSWQQSDGGFDNGFGSGSSNADTTSVAILSIRAAGEDPTDSFWSEDGNTPLDFLATCRTPDGSYDWQPGNAGFMPVITTTRALLARLGQPYPIATRDYTSVEVRIEGTSERIWNGEVYVFDNMITDSGGTQHYKERPTAIGALDEASQLGGFPYNVDNFDWGILVTSIDGDAGTMGWMYRVDYYSPMTGADTFFLDETIPPDPPHEKILFYAPHDWQDTPTSISIDKTVVSGGEMFTITVYYYDFEGNQYPADSSTGVKVVAGDVQYPTDATGQATLALHTEGVYEISAYGSGYVRSNTISVTVTESSGDNDDSNLQVSIIPALSLEVTPDSIDFGAMGPGDTSNSVQIHLRNTGSLNAIVTVTVTDKDSTVFQDCMQTWEENGSHWESWREYVELIEGHYGTRVEYVRLKIPVDYSPPILGLNEGTITYWLDPA